MANQGRHLLPRKVRHEVPAAQRPEPLVRTLDRDMVSVQFGDGSLANHQGIASVVFRIGIDCGDHRHGDVGGIRSQSASELQESLPIQYFDGVAGNRASVRLSVGHPHLLTRNPHA